MERPDHLVAAILEEDRLFRALLSRCPVAWREQRELVGALSLKETVGHLAFWDTFAVQFFSRKLDQAEQGPFTQRDFEQRNRDELQAMRELPYDDVVARYERATRLLLEFLRGRWHELSVKERRDFSLPLKHRRHHRLLLAKALEPHLAEAERRSQAGEA
jgi:hypothetical protein